MPTRAIQTILIVDDEGFEAEVLTRHLSGEYTTHVVVNDDDLAHRLFVERRPELLVLSFADIGNAKAFYLALMRRHPDERALPHQTFLFCQHKDEQQAMELCLHGGADDFIVGRPYFDSARLKLALHMAEERFRLRAALGQCDRHLSASARDLDALDRLRDDAVRQIDAARQQGDRLHSHMLRELDRDIRNLSRNLATKYNEDPEDGPLPSELRQFNRDLVRPCLDRHRRALTRPYETWAHAIERQVGNIADSGRCELSIPRRTVMAIDDDPVMQAYLYDLLNEAGYHVLLAGNGQQALLSLGRFHVDAILLDYRMPDMDGLAVIEHIRAMDGLSDVPILMLSVHSERHVVEECHASGAQDFIVKPVDAELLCQKLDKWISEKSGRSTTHVGNTSVL